MFKYKKLYRAQVSENERLSAANDLLRKTATDMNGAVQRSADEIANLNRQPTEKQIALDKAKEELASARAELTDAKDKLAKKLELLDSTNDALMEQFKKVEDLEASLKAKEAARSKVASSLKNETAKNENLLSALTDKEIKIAELEEQLVKLLEDNETLEHDLASVADDGSVLKGKCEGCVNEGNYRKCSSCIRGHAKDKYTPVEPEISSPADDGVSTNDETIIEEGAIVGEPVNMEDVPIDADVAELKELEIEIDTVPDAEPTADMDVAELKEDGVALDVPAHETINEVSLIADAPEAQRIAPTPAPASEDKAPAKKKPSRKKKKAAKKK